MSPNAPQIHNEAVDQTIDRALAALHDAQPRPGLNGRILASLEQRATAPQAARPAALARVALWTAASAAILAISSTVILLHNHPAPPTTARSYTPESPQLRVPQIPILGLGMESRSIPGERILSASRHPEQSAAQRISVFRVADGPRTAPTPVTDPDAQAVADLHAPSHPAPPLPLTVQEKLFVRLARNRHATQLAELNPAVRARQDAEETASFKAFFPDPPPLQQPNGDTE